jgi:hypothetical protein
VGLKNNYATSYKKSSRQIYQYHKIIYSGRSLQQLGILVTTKYPKYSSRAWVDFAETPI